ncbi:hypothetical protein BGW39_001223 [Mortierella sp. 14UC]|nr:hypothetical protein BGW39_001223 [Mortierella sp. 14UC]
MLAKTSTACFEVQKVIQFSPYAILVHSESKTPNVPYGEHFSTVNQICMTWESEGRTRIRCFTEVKFKRSIMWSSKVEAGSLEGSGGFYKEFIRQLEQLVESSRDQLLRSYNAKMLESRLIPGPFSGDVHDPAMNSPGCTSGSKESRPLLSTRISFDSTHSATRIGDKVPNPVPVQESTRPGPQEMSRARSLLSQQYLRNPPLSSTTGLPRLSLDSTRPPLVGTSFFVTQKSPLSTSTLPLEKKSALSIFIQSMTPPTYPIVSLAPEEPVRKAKASPSSSVTTGTTFPVPQEALTSPSLSTPTSSWIDLIRKSIPLLGHSSAATMDNGTLSSSSPALGSPIMPTFENEGTRALDKIGFPRVTFAVSTLPPSATLSASRSTESSIYIAKDRSSRQQTRRGSVQQHSPRRLSKVVLGCVILGLAVSALNIWHLFGVVSSMVEVVQLKENLLQRQLYQPLEAPTYRRHLQSYHPEAGNPNVWRPSSSFTSAAAVQSHSRTASFYSIARKPVTLATSNKPLVHSPQKFLPDKALLEPLHIQTAILRTEIIELFDLLEQARKELYHPRPVHRKSY